MDKKFIGFLVVFGLVTVWSGYNAFDTTLWFLEAGICLVGVAVLAITYHKFRFTDLSYIFILVHLIILLIGAHYSYAEEPFFNWLRDYFDLKRNNFDKVGHFAQGFVPALITRELLIRLHVIEKKSWLPFFVVCVALSISACYEFIEWWASGIFKQAAEDFLGTQGYIWDTQSDMFCAFIGAITMLVLLSKLQNKQISKLERKTHKNAQVN